MFSTSPNWARHLGKGSRYSSLVHAPACRWRRQCPLTSPGASSVSPQLVCAPVHYAWVAPHWWSSYCGTSQMSQLKPTLMNYSVELHTIHYLFFCIIYKEKTHLRGLASACKVPMKRIRASASNCRRQNMSKWPGRNAVKSRKHHLVFNENKRVESVSNNATPSYQKLRAYFQEKDKRYSRSRRQGVVLARWRSQTCWSALSVGGARVSPLYTLWAPPSPSRHHQWARSHCWCWCHSSNALMGRDICMTPPWPPALTVNSSVNAFPKWPIRHRVFELVPFSPLLDRVLGLFTRQKASVKQILPGISIIRARVMPVACSESIYSLKLQWLSSLIY